MSAPKSNEIARLNRVKWVVERFLLNASRLTIAKLSAILRRSAMRARCVRVFFHPGRAVPVDELKPWFNASERLEKPLCIAQFGYLSSFS